MIDEKCDGPGNDHRGDCCKEANEQRMSMQIAITHPGLGSSRNVQTGMSRRSTDPVSVHMFT
jgi:hypothetical protein